jgi:hypothetical protein
MATIGLDFDLSFLDITTTVKTNAAGDAKTIDVTTSTGMAAGDAVAITLNNADVHWDEIASVTDGDTIVITTGIPSAADAGNAVKSYNAYMCRSEGNRKMFSITDAPLLPPTLITGTASPSNIHPEREIRIEMKDWRKGFQQYLLDDGYTYYDSENCDARLKGKVTLPPKRLATLTWSAETTPTITDGNLETWQDGTTPNAAWTEAGDDAVQTATHHGTGTYGALGEGGVAKTGTFTQEVIAAGSIATFKGMIAKASVWGYTTGGGTGYVTVGFNDGDDTSTSAQITAGSWAQETIYHRISDSATSLDVVITWYATTVGAARYVYFDDCEFEVLVDCEGKRAVPNAGFEGWDSSSVPWHWVLDDGEWSRDGSNQRTDIYCLQLTEDGGGAEAHVDLPFNATNDQSRDFYLAAYCYQEGLPATCKIGINDGVGTTWSANITAAAYTSIVVKRTLAASATRLRIVLDVDDQNGDDLYIDDVEMFTSSVLGSNMKSIPFGDEIVVVSGTSLLKVNGSTDLTFLMDFGTITDLCVFEERLYIAQGWTHAFWYTSDLSGFIQSTSTAGITNNATATKSGYAAGATAIDVVDSSVFSAAGVFALWENEVIEVDAIVDADTITAIRAQHGTTAAYHVNSTDITEISATAGAKYMANVADSQFWISDTNSTMRVSSNPINNGIPFSTPYQIDVDAHDITGLVDSPSVVYCRKEDDVYYLSGANVISLLNLGSELSTTYAYPIYRWGDRLYIPSGTNSLYEYNESTGVTTTISPVRYAAGDANYDEDIIAIASDETYLYCALDNGSDIKILAGRWETVEGDTNWYWHPLYTLASHNDITWMLISSLTGSKRMYVGTDTATDGIQPYIIPLGYAEPYTEANYECEASGTFYTPWLDGGFPTEEKYWKEVDITTICCTDKTSIQASYQVKGGSWVALTTCTVSAYSSGYPDETTDTREIGVSSERIRFKFDLAAAVDEYTPILFGTRGGISVKAVLQSDRKRQINAQLLIADRINERTRTTLARTVSTDLTNLRAYYTANDNETVVAPDDTEYSITFDRESYREEAAYDETGHKYVWWVTVKLLEV